MHMRAPWRPLLGIYSQCTISVHVFETTAFSKIFYGNIAINVQRKRETFTQDESYLKKLKHLICIVVSNK